MRPAGLNDETLFVAEDERPLEGVVARVEHQQGRADGLPELGGQRLVHKAAKGAAQHRVLAQSGHRITGLTIGNGDDAPGADHEIEVAVLIPIEEVQLAAPAHAADAATGADELAIVEPQLAAVLHIVIIKVPVEVKMVVAIHDDERRAAADFRHGRTTTPHAMQVDAIAVERVRGVEQGLGLGATIQVDAVVARDVARDEVEGAVVVPIKRIGRQVAPARLLKALQAAGVPCLHLDHASACLYAGRRQKPRLVVAADVFKEKHEALRIARQDVQHAIAIPIHRRWRGQRARVEIGVLLQHRHRLRKHRRAGLRPLAGETIKIQRALPTRDQAPRIGGHAGVDARVPEGVPVLARDKSFPFEIKATPGLVAVVDEVSLPRTGDEVPLVAFAQIDAREAVHREIHLLLRLRDLPHLAFRRPAHEVTIPQLAHGDAGGVEWSPLLRVRAAFRALATIRKLERKVVTLAVAQDAEAGGRLHGLGQLLAFRLAEFELGAVELRGHQFFLVDPKPDDPTIRPLKHAALVLERALHDHRLGKHRRAILCRVHPLEQMHRLRPAVARHEEVRLPAVKHPRLAQHVMVQVHQGQRPPSLLRGGSERLRSCWQMGLGGQTKRSEATEKKEQGLHDQTHPPSTPPVAPAFSALPFLWPDLALPVNRWIERKRTSEGSGG